MLSLDADQLKIENSCSVVRFPCYSNVICDVNNQGTIQLLNTKFLDKFLVLIQFLQSFCIHAWDSVG